MADLNQLEILLTKIASQKPDNEVVLKTQQALSKREDAIRRKTCLEMAEKLNKTAFALETKAQPEMASKLYREALEIKQKNLSSNDPETASQLIDLARAEAGERQFETSEKHYERALITLRKSKGIDPALLVSALESYGMMLNDWHHEAKAKLIYEEANAVYRAMKSPKK